MAENKTPDMPEHSTLPNKEDRSGKSPDEAMNDGDNLGDKLPSQPTNDSDVPGKSSGER